MTSVRLYCGNVGIIQCGMYWESVHLESFPETDCTFINEEEIMCICGMSLPVYYDSFFVSFEEEHVFLKSFNRGAKTDD